MFVKGHPPSGFAFVCSALFVDSTEVPSDENCQGDKHWKNACPPTTQSECWECTQQRDWVVKRIDEKRRCRVQIDNNTMVPPPCDPLSAHCVKLNSRGNECHEQSENGKISRFVRRNSVTPYSSPRGHSENSRKCGSLVTLGQFICLNKTNVSASPPFFKKTNDPCVAPESRTPVCPGLFWPHKQELILDWLSEPAETKKVLVLGSELHEGTTALQDRYPHLPMSVNVKKTRKTPESDESSWAFCAHPTCRTTWPLRRSLWTEVMVLRTKWKRANTRSSSQSNASHCTFLSVQKLSIPENPLLVLTWGDSSHGKGKQFYCCDFSNVCVRGSAHSTGDLSCKSSLCVATTSEVHLNANFTQWKHCVMHSVSLISRVLSWERFDKVSLSLSFQPWTGSTSGHKAWMVSLPQSCQWDHDWGTHARLSAKRNWTAAVQAEMLRAFFKRASPSKLGEQTLDR